jgi:hypothetical protein
MRKTRETHEGKCENDGDHHEYRSGAALGILPLVLQITIEGEPSTPPLEIVVNIVLAVVGLGIAYQAVRAYSRNEDRSILLFGGGLFLLTTVQALLELTVITLQATLGIVSFLLGGLAFSLPLAVVFGGIGQAVDLLGLVAIFYALLK